jgi:YhcN/YlaJ family sporulation lipoprotein
MKPPKALLFLPLTALLGVSLVFGGCSAAKKPATPAPETTQTPNATTPANQNYPKDVADKVANEAKKVKDVQSATAIVAGKNIYLGLDLKPDMAKAGTMEAEKAVLDRVKNMEPNYTVTVTSDIDTVTRIKNVASGIGQGKPISSFDKEIKEINTRMSPKTK